MTDADVRRELILALEYSYRHEDWVEPLDRLLHGLDAETASRRAPDLINGRFGTSRSISPFGMRTSSTGSSRATEFIPAKVHGPCCRNLRTTLPGKPPRFDSLGPTKLFAKSSKRLRSTRLGAPAMGSAISSAASRTLATIWDKWSWCASRWISRRSNAWCRTEPVGQ
jgi:hypothetical protein